MKIKRKQKKRPTAIIESLEPRVLFSADLFGGAIDVAGTDDPLTNLLDQAAAAYDLSKTQVDQTSDQSINEYIEPFANEDGVEAIGESDSATSQLLRHELVVVDTATPDYQQLIDDILAQSGGDRAIEVVLLDARQDGIDQLSKIFSGYSNLDAVHLISHGSAGEIHIGNGIVDNAALQAQADQVATWRASLNQEADLLIYGCNLTSNAEGELFVDSLAKLTGADVAASDDLTGHERFSADWDLEYKKGEVDTSIVFTAQAQHNWSSILATYTVTNTDDSGAGSLRQAIIDANANAGLDGISFNIAGSGIHTIELDSELPTITDAVIINGASDPDFADSPVIQLDGSEADENEVGLHVSASGSGSTIRGLIINNFSSDGILLDEANNNTIRGNYIGTNASGTTDQGNKGHGVNVYNGDNNTIRDNVISGNDLNGVILFGEDADNNSVIGNKIGTNAAGTAAIGNKYDGVVMDAGADTNTIGGTTAAERNIISGNLQDGIELDSATTTSNTIQGNYIGTTADGLSALGNQRHGVVIYNGVSDTTIGGTPTGAGNVISSNAENGIHIDGNYNAATANNTVQGNYIGLNANGDAKLGNGEAGMRIYAGANNNTIGGTEAEARNVISGNVDGIYLQDSGTTNNIIQGNYIGTDATGMLDLGNSDRGIQLESGANNNTIGGTVTGAGNVISGNDNDGIIISDGASPGTGTTGNVIQGNYIGVAANGTSALGNATNGVRITTEDNNTIGGTAAGAGNIIAYNTFDGVVLQNSSANSNPILSNAIYANDSNGIDLGNNGQTSNDTGDGDGGANNLQNYPVLISAETSGSHITITGTLNSTANSYFRVEFFASSSGDATDHGEGQEYLGFANVATDGTGNTTFNAILTANVADGAVISATATKSNATYNTFTDTSEFAENITASAVNAAPRFGANGDGSVTTAIPNSLNNMIQASVVQDDGKIIVAGSSVLTDWDMSLVRYNVDGSLDPTFGGGDGIVTLDLGGQELAFDLTLQSDGKILLAGQTDTGGDVDFAIVRLNTDGTLDTDFDTDGVAVTNIGGDDNASAVIMQSDGKILVAGDSDNGGNNIAVVRYNTNGSLDTNFADEGILDLDFGGNSFDMANSLALQSNDKILVGGQSSNQFALVRLNTNGTLDGSFDTDGKLTTNFGAGSENINSVAIQEDGKILAGGTANLNFALARYNINGSLDTNFDTDGLQTSDMGGNEQAYDIALQGDGKIMISGVTNIIGTNDIFLQRYNTNGTIDTTFNTVGSVICVDNAGNETGHSVQVRDNGAIAVGSYSSTGGFQLSQYNSDCTADTNFGMTTNLLDGNPTFIEDGSPVVLDTDVVVFDQELSAADNFDGASLTLSRNGGANAEDLFSATGTLGAINEGNNLVVSGTTIGTVTTNASGTLVFTFNNNATNTLVNAAMQQIAYNNSSNTPPACVQIDWTFDDGNAGSQGTGGNLTTFGSTVVSITAVNDAPVVDTGGPYSIAEGESLALDASGTNDAEGNTLTYRWDLDYDGAYDDLITSASSTTINWAVLQSAGITDDGLHTIGLQVDDGEGGVTNTSTDVTVSNTTPTLTTTGAATVNEDAVYTLNLGATDPGNDSITSWTINWGDGTIETIAGNPASVTHTYTQPNHTYNILASATDEDGTFHQNQLLLANYDGNSILRFEPTTGAHLQTFGDSHNLKLPIDMILGPDNKLYVSGYGSDDIQRFDANTGAFVDKFVAPRDNGLSGPTGLAIGPDGNLYVASHNTGDVYRYDGTSGAFIDKFITSATGGLRNPEGMIFGADGNLYIADYNDKEILRFNGHTGAFIDTFVTAGSGGLTWPEQLVFGPDGNLYVGSWNNTVLRYNGSTGAFIDEFITPGAGGLWGTTGIAFGPDGHLYVSSYENDSLIRFDGESGDLIDVYVPDSTAGLKGTYYPFFLPEQRVTVNPVNDAPAGADKTVTTNEDTNYTFSDVDFGFSDDDDNPPDSLANVIIKTAPSNGALYVDENGNSAVDGSEALASNDTVTAADISAGKLKFKPVSDANGTSYDSFTFQVQDDGGTSNSGIDTDQSANTIIIDVTAVNDDPTNTGSLPTKVTVIEDVTSNIDLSALNISDVDAGNNLVTVTLRTNTGGRLFASSDFDVTVLGNGFNVMTLTGGVADLNNFFSSATHFQYLHDTTHTSGNNADTIQIEINDNNNTGIGGSGTVVLGTVTVDITPVNDAPVISGANNLNPINEDEFDSSGTLISDLISGMVSDGDAATLNGIAVVAVDNTNGSWEYTTDGGTNWLAFGSPNSANARLLASDTDTYVRFVPKANWNGTVVEGITFHAWDQTSGVNGGLANLSTTSTVGDNFNNISYANNSGTTSWSTDWIEFDKHGGDETGGHLYVYGISHQLVLNVGDSGEKIYREADLSGATTASLTFDYQNQLIKEDEILLRVSGNGGSNFTTVMKFSGTQNTGSDSTSIDISSYIASDTQIQFYVNKKDNGQRLLIDNVQILYDNPGNSTGGDTAFSAASVTSDIVVHALNDEPVVSAAITSIANEDAASYSLDLLANASDVDDSDTLNIDNLTLTSGDASGISVVGNTLNIDPTAYNSLADGESEVITYSYDVTDGNGGTVATSASITITGVNDTPLVSAATTSSANEDAASYTLDLLANASDADGSDTLNIANLTLTGGDGSGITVVGNTLNIDPSAYNNLADGESEVITYSYDVTDGNGGTVATSASITISGVNDVPVVSAATTSSANEDAATYTLDLLANASDADDSDTLNIANLTLTSGDASGITVVGNTLNIDPSAYNSLADGELEVITYSYDVTDGNGGTVATSASITISGVNDAPVVSAATTSSTNENAAGYTVDLLANASDGDTNDSLNIANLTLTGGDASGISLVGNTLNIDPSAYNSLADGESEVITCSYDVIDGNGGTVATTASITINGVNDAPVVSAVTTNSTNEDAGSYTLDLLANASDADANDTLSIANLTLMGGDASGITVASNTLNIDPSAYNNLADGESEVITYSYDVSDGNGGTVATNASITISGVNDSPVVSAAMTSSANEDAAAYAVNLLTNASDADSSDTLNIANLTLTSGDALGITLVGNTVNIDPGAYLRLADGESEVITYSYDVTDGNGGTVATSASITIRGVNDAPVVSAVTTSSTNEDAAGYTLDLLANASDADASDTLNIANLTLTSGDVSGIILVGNTLNIDPSAYNNLGDGESEIITYSYDVTDGNGGTVTTSANITINGIYEPLPNILNTTSFIQESNDDSNIKDPKTDDQQTDDVEMNEDETTVTQTPEENIPPEATADTHKATHDVATDPGLTVMVDDTLYPPPMDGTALANVVADLPRNSYAYEYQDLAFKPIPPKAIDLRNLDIAPFELEKPEPVQMQSPMDNDAFIKDLDRMNQDLDKSLEESKTRYRIAMDTAVGLTLSLSAGFVSWVLKTGSLMASFMSTMPLWKQLDPLPILGAAMIKKRKKYQLQHKVAEDKEDAKVEGLFK